MAEPSETSLRSGLSELRLYWSGDRFQHRIASNDSFRESIDSDSADSPVYTELHQQGELVFLSGNAGFGHCSASIEPSDDGFLWDVACRVTSGQPAVASLYEGKGMALRPESDAVATAESADVVWRIDAPNAPSDSLPYLVRYRYWIGPTP